MTGRPGDRRTSVAIVGAGIAGLALGALLDRERIPFHVVERRPTIGALGVGIQLSPNGTRVLDRLGLGAALARRGVAASHIVTRRWDDGTRLGRAGLTRYDTPYWVIRRCDLHELLLAAVPGHAVTSGAACVGLRHAGDGVAVDLDDGGTLTADVVVGADGAHSTIRSLLVGDAPVHSGFSVFRALVPAAAVPEVAASRAVAFWLGPDRHLTYYPVSGGQDVHVSVVVRDRDGADHPGSDPDDRRTRLLTELRGWHPRVRDLVASTTGVSRWPVVDRDVPPSFVDGRVALVGDAAHLMLPYLSQGANQALEDVAVLADVLAGPDDPTTALRAYDAVRRPRVAEVHRRSRACTSTFHLPDGPAQRGRDALLGDAGPDERDWLYAPAAPLVPAR